MGITNVNMDMYYIKWVITKMHLKPTKWDKNVKMVKAVDEDGSYKEYNVQYDFMIAITQAWKR